MAKLIVTEEIRSLLKVAAEDPRVHADLRHLASAIGTTVPWDLIKRVVEELRVQGRDDLNLYRLCQSSALVLKSPEQRTRSPILIANCARLQERLDNQRYNAMVADVTVAERKAADMKDAVLPTARLQIGFGLQVLVTMFTFFLLGYLGTKNLFSGNELWAGLIGILGLTFGLLMETTLLIIRTNRPQPLHERFPMLFDTKIWGPGGTGASGMLKDGGSSAGGEARVSSMKKQGQKIKHSNKSD